MSTPQETSPGRWVWDHDGLRYGVQAQGNLALAYTCDNPTDRPTNGTVTGYKYTSGKVYFFGITADDPVATILKSLILQVWDTDNFYRGRTDRG
jgi:hypothetical protein